MRVMEYIAAGPINAHVMSAATGGYQFLRGPPPIYFGSRRRAMQCRRLLLPILAIDTTAAFSLERAAFHAGL